MQICRVSMSRNYTKPSMKTFKGSPSTMQKVINSHNFDMSKGIVATALGLITYEIKSDGVGGFKLPNGNHISIDGTGGYTLPDGSHISLNGMGGFRLPNGQHVSFENEDFD